MKGYATMKRTILAAALVLAALPAWAADPSPAPDQAAANLSQQWQAMQTQLGNLQQAMIRVLQEQAGARADNAALQQQLADLRKQCGDRCEPVKPAAPSGATAPATEPTKP